MSSDLTNELNDLESSDHAPPPPPVSSRGSSPADTVNDHNVEVGSVGEEHNDDQNSIPHHQMLKHPMRNQVPSPSLDMQFNGMSQYPEENLPFPQDFYPNQQQPPHQRNYQKPNEENWDSLAVTQVVSSLGAEMSLNSQREYSIAKQAAQRMNEMNHQRLEGRFQQQNVNFHRYLNAQNGMPHQMATQSNAPPGFHLSREMPNGQQGIPLGMNIMLGGEMNAMGGPSLPQIPHMSHSMDSLKAEPGAAKRKLMVGDDDDLDDDDDDSSSISGQSSKKSRGGTARWTKEQDEALKDAVQKFDGRNWKAIAELVPGRDHVQCLQRWKKVLRPGLVKGHWSKEEDDLLLQLIQDEKMHSWAMVASKIKGRTAKQCRERWSLNLDPGINRSAWTNEEDALLLQLYDKMGGKWSEIKSEFDGRTENAVKTRYKSLQRAKAREWTPDQDRALVQLRLKYGKNWVAIKKELPGRSRNAIKVRCKTLEYDGNLNS